MSTTITPPRVTQTHAVGTLVVAFADDPVLRWFFPAGGTYLTTFAALAGRFADLAFPAETADLDPRGTSLWMAPDTQLPTDDLGEILLGAVAPARQSDVLTLFERIATHHPTEPHWYLPFIGVDPVAQGRGIGSALLRRGLERCDRDGLSAYLEASAPGNRRLYERHGFEVVGELRTADSPPLWPMLRPAGGGRR
jgi:GNAT superfamily N-acetyltransferase